VGLASLRDSPKLRPDVNYPFRVPVKGSEAKLKGVAKPKGLLPEPTVINLLPTNLEMNPNF
jgi:hypothetical protein